MTAGIMSLVQSTFIQMIIDFAHPLFAAAHSDNVIHTVTDEPKDLHFQIQTPIKKLSFEG